MYTLYYVSQSLVYTPLVAGWRRLTEVLMVANDPKVNAPDREVVFSVLERQHAHRAMALYIKSLERSRANELHGSDIYRFRTLDIGIAEAVKQRLA